MWNTVSAQEIADLLREGATVVERGPAATSEERQAFRLRRLSILERIATDPGPFLDPDEAGWLKSQARTEAIAMRLGGRSLPGGL
jgi:hypothetical protein